MVDCCNWCRYGVVINWGFDSGTWTLGSYSGADSGLGGVRELLKESHVEMFPIPSFLYRICQIIAFLI